MKTPFIDPDAMAALYECGDSTVVGELIDQMISDFARLHGQAITLLGSLVPDAETDFAALRRLAHEAKGLALTIGAHKLTEVCSLAESLAQQGDRSGLAQCWPELIGLCSDVRVELAKSRMRV